MSKIYYVTLFLIILIVSFLGITYSFEYENDDSLSFDLIGPSTLYMDVNTKYVEYGIKVIHNGVDVSDKVEIDNSKVNPSKIGEYKVRYEYNSEYVNRIIKVIDSDKPVIELIGGNEVYILLNGLYNESGYTVSDNYDTDLDSKVKVESDINTNAEGTYTIKYSVTDSSGNIGEATRKVIVKKPNIKIEHNFTNRVTTNAYNVLLYSNTIIKNNFYDYGIYYEGYVRENASRYKIRLKNRDNDLEYVYNMNSDRGNYYNGNLNLTTVKSGTYDVYVIGNNEERLLDKMDSYSRIVRAKVGSKLATVIYDDDLVSIKVEEFKYHYDVAIDPGHGGSDIGAANGIIAEKNLNLMVSKYEKCRFESMGYKVYMARYDDTYGEVIGDDSWDQLDRKGLTIGYYGAVSRIVYSNHHNGSYNSGVHGFELLVGNQATAKELTPEFNIYNRFKKYYELDDGNIRIYSRDYYTDQILSKANGEVYDNKNYYAVIRIPYELFNVKNTIYEPIYMSNSNDFNWYYSSGNWVNVSEIKIEEYVKYLGGTYNSDNKSCL